MATRENLANATITKLNKEKKANEVLHDPIIVLKLTMTFLHNEYGTDW